MKKKILIVITILVALVVGFYYFAYAPTVDPTAWKTYKNAKYGFSIDYPPTFAVEENQGSDYFDMRISDPSTRASYFSLMVWEKQSSVDEVKDFFTGPYPKQVSVSGNSPLHTVIERTFHGIQGIEQYGFGAEGHSYDDVFMYKNTYLWAMYLNPVVEGRIKEPIEPGEPVPDKTTYERILSSVRISPK